MNDDSLPITASELREFLVLASSRFEDLTVSYASRLDDQRLTAYACHARRVRKLVGCLAELSGSDETVRLLGEITALLHDVGRYAQLAEFARLEDSDDCSHAALSRRLIETGGLLAGLPEAATGLIITAVAMHSLPLLPKDVYGELRQVARLLRDADKLDQLATASTEFAKERCQRDPHTLRPTKNGSGYNAAALNTFSRGRIVPLADVVTELDLRLFYLSWIYDMESPLTIKLASERGDLASIAAGLGDGKVFSTVSAANHSLMSQFGVFPFGIH